MAVGSPFIYCLATSAIPIRYVFTAQSDVAPVSAWVHHTNALIVLCVFEVPRVLRLMAGWWASSCREDLILAVDAKERPVGCGCIHYMDYDLANERLDCSTVVFRNRLLEGLDGLAISMILQGVDHSFLTS
jgi:hypothetical protein